MPNPRETLKLVAAACILGIVALVWATPWMVSIWRAKTARENCAKLGRYMHTVTPETYRLRFNPTPVGMHVCVVEPELETP